MIWFLVHPVLAPPLASISSIGRDNLMTGKGGGRRGWERSQIRKALSNIYHSILSGDEGTGRGGRDFADPILYAGTSGRYS